VDNDQDARKVVDEYLTSNPNFKKDHRYMGKWTLSEDGKTLNA